jgi:hypothetical protein
MTRIIIDKAMLAKLHNLTEYLEVCDESGKRLGFFSPAVEESLDVPFSEEELDRFDREPGGRSLAEILRDLESKG